MNRFVRDHAAVPIHLVGAAILALSVAHVLADDDPIWAELLEGSILVVFAAATVYVGYRFGSEGSPIGETLRTTAIGLGGGVLVGLLATLFVVVRSITAEPTSEAWFVVSIGWSVGAGGGIIVGYFYERVSASLTAQRDLAKRLTVLQRVLRHNLRNEVTVIAGAAADVADRVDDPVVQRKLEMIDRHVRQVAELSENSQRLTRVWQTDGVVTFDVESLLVQEVDRFRGAYPSIPVELEPRAGGRVRAHPQIRLAVREALENAAVHNRDVAISVSVGVAEDGLVPIEIADTGDGIPTSEVEPLWRSGEQPLAHTSGLGLWLIYWLVEESGGELSVETATRSDAVDGTVLTMWLPADR